MADDNLIKRSWRQLVFDVPRFWTNAKSRRRVLIQLLVLAVVGGVWGLYVGGWALLEFRAVGWWGLLWVGILYALAFSTRSVMKRRGNAITLSLDRTPAPHLRQRVLDQRLILATVVARAAFEAARKAGAIAEGAVPNARAVQNQRLRKDGIWDALPSGLNDLLASQEGSWGEAQINRALLYVEAVRVLNWFVREDCALADLRLSQVVSPNILETVLKEPDPARTINFLRRVVEVDREAGPAGVYLSRLTSELVKRGESDGERDGLVEEHVESYMKYAAYVGDADIMADDLPIGGELIGEAETPVLLALRGTGAVRLVMLGAARQLLIEEDPSALEEAVADITRSE